VLSVSLQAGKNPKRRRKQLHDLSDISSVGFKTYGALDEYRFNMFMRDLLTEKAKDIFRCKGVLAVHVSGWFELILCILNIDTKPCGL
jgi:G3E family GTPase